MTITDDRPLTRAEVRVYARQCASRYRLERIALFAEAQDRGYTVAQAAASIGVHTTTGERYAAWLRRQEAT
jgi:hypothetical protein